MNMDLYVRKKVLHRAELWWVCIKEGERKYTPFADIYAPTGYGFKSKAKCERVAREIENRLKSD